MKFDAALMSFPALGVVLQDKMTLGGGGPATMTRRG